MHNLVPDWWTLLGKRGADTNQSSLSLTSGAFTEQDKKTFGIGWEFLMHQRGGVTLTMPLVPVGPIGPAMRTRRVLLPGYVRIREDLHTLKALRYGDADLLAKAHRTLTAPFNLSPGAPRLHLSAPYRFPAAVQLTGLVALLDALVDHVEWDLPAVLQERDIVLGPEAAALAFIKKWRIRAVKAVILAFQVERQAERTAFRDNSYFNLLDTHLDVYLSMPRIALSCDNPWYTTQVMASKFENWKRDEVFGQNKSIFLAVGSENGRSLERK